MPNTGKRKKIHEKHITELIELVGEFKKSLQKQKVGLLSSPSEEPNQKRLSVHSGSLNLYGRIPHVADRDVETGETEPLLRNPIPRKISNIPLQDRHLLEFLLILLGGIALSFNSGFINGVTLSSSMHLPTAHVTGTMSHAGMAYVDGRLTEFLTDGILVLVFLMGAVLSGALVSSKTFNLGLGTDYFPLLFIETLLLLAACLLEYLMHGTMFYYYLASMASGLQNGITSKYSGSMIRSTHVTGSCTDIGLTLGALYQGESKDCWKLYVLIPLVIGFFGGAVSSQVAYLKYEKASLVVNVIVIFSTAMVYLLYLKVSSSFSKTYSHSEYPQELVPLEAAEVRRS